jgi:hypothetical protein
VKPDRITRAFVAGFAIILSGTVIAQFVLEGWPTVVILAAGGIIALVGGLPVFEAFGEDEVEKARAEALAGAEPQAIEALSALIGEGDPNSEEYREAIELAVRISGQLRDLAHAGRARVREAQLRRAL